jgi:hypothetical protein
VVLSHQVVGTNQVPFPIRNLTQAVVHHHLEVVQALVALHQVDHHPTMVVQKEPIYRYQYLFSVEVTTLDTAVRF